MKFLKSFNEKFDDDLKHYTSKSNGIIKSKFEDIIDHLQELLDEYKIQYVTEGQNERWVGTEFCQDNFWMIRGNNVQVPAKKVVGVRGHTILTSDPQLIIKMSDDSDLNFLDLWSNFEKDLANSITKIENRINRKIFLNTQSWVRNVEDWGDAQPYKVVRGIAVIHLLNIKHNESTILYINK